MLNKPENLVKLKRELHKYLIYTILFSFITILLIILYIVVLSFHHVFIFFLLFTILMIPLIMGIIISLYRYRKINSLYQILSESVNRTIQYHGIITFINSHIITINKIEYFELSLQMENELKIIYLFKDFEKEMKLKVNQPYTVFVYNNYLLGTDND